MNVAKSAAVSHTGRKRRHNEDAYVAKPPLFAIADGMGGARAGEVASQLAAAAVKADETTGAGADRVEALIQEANRRIYQRASEDADTSGMGTTMTVALVADSSVTFGHVGDSRAYVFRDGVLEQVTDDHSLVAELVRGGKLSPEEAEHHPQRSVITRALGTDPDVDIDTFAVDAEPGDVFLLCSDGLTDMVSDETIERVLGEHRDDLEAAVAELVRLANKAGGEDNITVVAFEVTDAPAEPDERTVEQTRPLPALDDGGPEPEPIEPAAVDTAVVKPDELEQLQARSRSKRSFWPLVLLLLLIAIAAVALWLVAR
jgi:PPM family protein phosphatase